MVLPPRDIRCWLGLGRLVRSFARSVGKIVLTVVSTRAAFALLFCYMYSPAHLGLSYVTLINAYVVNHFTCNSDKCLCSKSFYMYYVDLDLQGLALTAGMAQALTLHATIVNLARPTIALSQDFGSFILI